MSLLKDPPHEASAAPTRTPHPEARRGTGLFRAFWRWHFYAALIVIPTVLILAITGLIYLFRFQLEPMIHAELMRVTAPADAVATTYDEQLTAVQQARPDDAVVSMTEPATA